MPKYNNLYGMKFGNLEVIGKEPVKRNKNIYWLCKCICGNEKYIFQGNLTSEKSKSCGCLTYCNRKRTDKKLKRTFSHMKQRCYNPNHCSYKNYGGRGIRVCDEWLQNSWSFYKWAKENGYNSELSSFECTIDRIDVNGNYEPSNCRWVSMMEQQQNRRNNKKIAIKGEIKTKAEWARKFNITRAGFDYRLKHGLIK